jgi:hypothetical protein
VNPQLHDEFVALCALYHSGDISEEEWALLQIHMAYCDSCHERFLQYQQIKSDLIPAMAAVAASDLDVAPEESASDIDAAEKRLMSRLDSDSTHKEPPITPQRKDSLRIPTVLIAACVAAATVLVGVYFLHIKRQSVAQVSPPVLSQQAPQATTASTPITDSSQALNNAREEVATIQKQLTVSEDRLKQSRLAVADMEKQLHAEEAARKQANDERDTLSTQLTAAQTEVQSLRNRIASAGEDTAQQATQMTTLEAEVRELKASLNEKELALNEKDQILALDKDFLAHDRDIRDLIGARNLYIADIFDTTENRRTAKQFGRIFYTKDRSLVFYGFDLDSQAGHKQDVSFQVWGSSSDRPSPVSLGLFYQDDTHKRWVLRCNDEKTLARLNMVFVTVEPSGGSTRPTGKQLLRAYLQIQPNHP